MTEVIFDVVDLVGEVHPGDAVRIWPPFAATTVDGRVKSTRAVEINVSSGPVTKNVDPGALMVQLQCDGFSDTQARQVTVPEAGPVSLRDLLLNEFDYAPAVVSTVARLTERAEDATERAEDIADTFGSLNGVTKAVSDAAASAQAARESAETATSAASSANESGSVAASSASTATQAEQIIAEYRQTVIAARDETLTARGETVTAAGNAAASESNAADSAMTAAGSQAGAQAAEVAASDSAAAAAASAAAATVEADRAKKEADRAGQAAEESSVKAVSDKVNEILAGAPEAYDTLLEIATELERGASAEAALTAAIAGKAPLDHIHTAQDVGAAPAFHEHNARDVWDASGSTVQQVLDSHELKVREISGIKTSLDSKVNTSDVSSTLTNGSVVRRTATGTINVASPTDPAEAATKGYVDAIPWLLCGEGAPPESLPGAAVGRFYLDVTTGNIHKITGV
ncbi:hypothetical protein [Corynebacterium lipophiloflavum]|uniref:Uncharacterized protein n=1 Tax=Corynebacterium lipophiloflavum (strain ATCC 700352 / DSM 44291 / CCUG 37336 / JCM 10383 / DMMZ 1944) TaxID=525263 RepID=C0XU23_CORLD|nr:hypothetical protein [Corynebacterium lipophiloflavum]EEI16249.1 hypothetical protein HMPREF0298_1943 [Corynebacterium lipophiloflavum DSM 44291]